MSVRDAYAGHNIRRLAPRHAAGARRIPGSLSGGIRPPAHADHAALKFVLWFFFVPLLEAFTCLLLLAWWFLGK